MNRSSLHFAVLIAAKLAPSSRLRPPNLDPEDAALPELCLAFVNSNEFVFID